MVLAVMLVAAVIYANALRNGFAGDDVAIIRDNSYVHGLGHWKQLLLGSYWPNSDELYRPVALLSFAIDWTISAGSVAWLHAANVLLHAGTTALVVLLALRLGAPHLGGLLGGIAFAIHPVHVEAVANIVGRAEILSALFFLLACHLHLSEQLRPLVRIGGVAVLYLLALGAKESAVTLPAVLLVLDLHRHGTTPGALRQVVRNSTPLLLALAVTLGCYLALRQAALGQVLGSAAAPYLYTLSTADRLATAVRLWPEFLRLLFWPRALSAEWGPGTINPATWRDPLFGAGLLLGVTVAAVAWIGWRRARWIWLAVLWFGVTFLPISQIPFPIGVMLAERLLYLPSVALVFIAPAVVSWLSRMPRPAQASGAAVVCLVLALGAWHTWSRTPVWQSEESFAEALHRDRPESYRSLWLTADGYVRQGDLAAAVPLYARAVELTHGYHHNLNINYSSVLLATGRPAEAEVLMRKSLPREPRNPAGYHLLSMSLLQQRQYRYALHVLERGRAVAHMSPVAESRFARTAALAYDALGKPDSARIHYMASTRAR